MSSVLNETLIRTSQHGLTQANSSRSLEQPLGRHGRLYFMYISPLSGPQPLGRHGRLYFMYISPLSGPHPLGRHGRLYFMYISPLSVVDSCSEASLIFLEISGRCPKIIYFW